jgi:hypothetical protein
LGVQLQALEVRDPEEFERAFEAATRGGAAGLIVFSSPSIFEYRTRLADLAAKNGLPAISPFRAFAEAEASWPTGQTLLPATRLAEALQTTRIHRVSGLTGGHTSFVTTRPLRAPHHMISAGGVVGGGRLPMPEEEALAHHGILCLDELPECTRPRARPRRSQHPSAVVKATASRANILLGLQPP